MESTTPTASPLPAVPLKHILVPIDFSPPSRKALSYAQRFAKWFGAELTLLHVSEKVAVAGPRDISPPLDFPKDQMKTALKKLQTLATSSKTRGLPGMAALVRQGLAAHEIVRAAKELESDLIVIATHGDAGWQHFCLGSTSEQVVRAAPCPVFVVREKERELI